ncbi:hypothetical protein CSUI_004606, partial [Cystoisospora suis]
VCNAEAQTIRYRRELPEQCRILTGTASSTGPTRLATLYCAPELFVAVPSGA